MRNCTKYAYAKILIDLVLILKPGLNSKSNRINLEKPFVLSFKDIFPSTHINGCFFYSHIHPSC